MLWCVLVLLCAGLGLAFRWYRRKPPRASLGFCFGDNIERRDNALSLIFTGDPTKPYVARIPKFLDAVRLPRGRDASYLGHYARLLQSLGTEHFVDTQKQLHAEEFSVRELEVLADVVRDVPDFMTRQLRVNERLEAETRRYAALLWNELAEPTATQAAQADKTPRRVSAA